jgi:ApaG protein
MNSIKTQTTNGVKISVEMNFRPDHSSQTNNRFVFAYRISIQNLGQVTVQLLRRYWLITDSDGTQREVEGDGVIGEKPVLRTGEIHQYTSGCHLFTEIGSMEGFYTMLNVQTGKTFEVYIPKFNLVAPLKLN